MPTGAAADMDALLISLVSACTALVASIVGPIVTLAVSRRQFNAAVLSTNRQRWIETLRDLVAEAISLLVAALVVKSQWKDRWDEGRGALEADAALREKLERLVLTQSKISLLMNPNEADHQRLEQAIATAFKRVKQADATDSQSEADIEAITSLTQSILKREWHRVKTGT
jgi:hypothetical protein